MAAKNTFDNLVPISFVCKLNERTEEGTRAWPEIESIFFCKISTASDQQQDDIHSIQVSKDDNKLADALKQVSFSSIWFGNKS